MAKRNERKHKRRKWEIAPLTGLPLEKQAAIRRVPPYLVPKRRAGTLNWQAQGTILRLTVRSSLKTKDPSDAWLACEVLGQEIYDKRFREKNGLPPKSEDHEMTLVEATEEYIGYRRSDLVREDREGGKKRAYSDKEVKKLRRAVSFFPKGMLIKQLNEKTMKAAALVRWPQGIYGPTYARDHKGLLRPLLEFAVIEGWCAMPPLTPTTQWVPLKDWLPPSTICALLDQCHPNDANMFIISAIYGYHKSEIIKLKRRDVDLVNEMITVQTKAPSGKIYVRRNKLLPRARAVLQAILDIPGRPNDQLFLRSDGSPLGKPSSANGYIDRALKRAKALAGIQDRFTHRSFRSTMATWLLSATDGSFKTVKSFAGWQSYLMVEAYTDEIYPEIVSGVLSFYGLPRKTNLAAWLGFPVERGTPSSQFRRR